MEHELRLHLIALADAFCRARGISPATVGRLAAGDWRFFDRLGDDDKTFTARKYDGIVDWLDANWPADTLWPIDVPRPSLRQPEQGEGEASAGGGHDATLAETAPAGTFRDAEIIS